MAGDMNMKGKRMNESWQLMLMNGGSTDADECQSMD